MGCGKGVDSVSVEPFVTNAPGVKNGQNALLSFSHSSPHSGLRQCEHTHTGTRHRSFTPHLPPNHAWASYYSCRRGLELGPVVEPLRHHDLADDLPVRSELHPLPTLLAGWPEDLALQPGEGGLLLVAQALLHCIQV